MSALPTPPQAPQLSRRARGFGRVLIVLYGLLAIAATGRSVLQLATDFERAPLPYSLSALAAVVYIVATVALVIPRESWWRVAVITIGFELLFVLVVGTLTVVDPSLFPQKTVWSVYGMYYAFVPLVLPVVGLFWLRRTRPVPAAAAAASGD
ncbi:hypothetical protein QT381_06380 [Galbitalea sp. SE-J8]|uniref:hypothetical protein n=1 Tax=Galbitalea sp. SE-J8 TaxID=3054952 RepID=UPI00259CBB0A|nr:hypothetical protein [Galbitalea sp. SE-J8]MDM4762629.1 hypothetical protein [Galbitalea sp. SE-J8]